MGSSLSLYKKKTQFGMNNLPESLAKLGTQPTETESKAEPELESKAESEPESKAESEPESKAEPEPESKAEPEPESKAEPELETFNMVPIPEKSSINKNNQKLLIFDYVDQSNILQEISINKNSTLNSGNKNLLLY
jgi:hypothetical protein